MSSLTTIEVLLREAKEIHGKSFPAIDKKIADCTAVGEWPPEPDSEAEYEFLADVYRELLSLNSVALCLSGGGIRSASFALGVLEALARNELVEEFHYLSTVSGGGYIGSWLSAWIHRCGRKDVFEQLAKGRKEIKKPAAPPKLLPDREPDPLHALRADSNYLTPKLGLMSADTWTGIALYVRNLLMNWAVIGTFILAVVMLPSIVVTLIGTATAGWFGIIAIAVVLALTAWAFATASRPTWARTNLAQAPFLWLDLVPFFVGSLFWITALRSGAIVPDHWWRLCPYLGQPANFIVDFAIASSALATLGWLLGARPVKPPESCEPRYRQVWDAASWVIAGAIFGAVVAGGSLLYVGLAHDYPNGILVLGVILGPLWILQAQVTAETFFVGFRSAAERGTDDREWLARSAGWYSAAGIGWALFCAVVLLGPDAIAALDTWLKVTYVPHVLASAGGVSGVITTLLGKSSLTSFKQTAQAFRLNIVLAVAAPVFVVSLIVGLSAFADWILYHDVEVPNYRAAVHGTWWVSIAWCAGITVVGVITSYFVNINRFSLHSVYRNRLIRAFLGASNDNRHENKFTGFDPTDNVVIADLWPATIGPAEQRPPFHMVNMALNVVSTRNLAWQERMAEPFIATPLHCGSDRAGYRTSGEYGKKLSLGTAMAISGAAVSPSMGYHSSPSLSFLLALFNVRLGWWLGNPGPEGERTYKTDGPKLGAWWLAQETLGLTTDSRGYVYLSDGGHFENLGLYEMVRRRCRHIVVCDAGCDPEFAFEDLGNAVRKIRIDLGVEIKFFGLDGLRKRRRDVVDKKCCSAPVASPDPGSRAVEPYWDVGIITYPESAANGSGNCGLILYLKPGIRGDEPADVVSYAHTNSAFPHETTADQWFSESQFESYRALGAHVLDSVIGNSRVQQKPRPRTLKVVLEALREAPPTPS